MWIPEKIQQANNSGTVFTASASSAGGSSVRLGSASGTLFSPYGYFSMPAQDVDAVVVQSGRTYCVCGFESAEYSGIEPGEVAIFSAGGASIVLKNDGRVLINGQQIGG